MRRKIVVFLSIMYSLVLVAQYPVNLQASLNGMATPYLSDYASNNKLNITATLNDPTTLSLPIEIRFVIIGSGKRIENPMTFHPSMPITLTQFVALPVWGYQIQENMDANNLQFSGLDKNTYLQKKCLPEDVYSIQLQAFKWGTNIAVSQVAEIPGLWITESDPPQLNMPVDKSGVQAFLPQNILFSWTPMHIDAPGSFTDYKLELWEVIQNRNPNEVVLNTKPLWTKTLASQLIFNYGVMETQLDTGKTYAWRIQALDRDGKSYFKDNGYSQVWTFRYLPESQMPYIVPPTNLKAEEIETESAKLTWDIEPRYQGYRVEYRKTSGGKWHSQETEETKVYARNLEPKTKYEAKIQGKNGDFYGNYSSKIEFTTKEKIALKCGENPMIPTRPTLPPLTVAEKGMLIHVGLFDMVLTEVSGGGGSFSGKGYLGFPYLIALARGVNYVKEAIKEAGNTQPKCIGCFAVVFDNIGIDNERHLASGEVHVVTTGFKAFVEKEMEKQDSVNKAKGTKPKDSFSTASNIKEDTSKTKKLDSTTNTNANDSTDTDAKPSYSVDKKDFTKGKNSKTDSTSQKNKGNGADSTTNNSVAGNGGSSNGSSAAGSNTNDSNKHYILYEGKKYYNGETITIKYESGKKCEFKYPKAEGNAIKWEISIGTVNNIKYNYPLSLNLDDCDNGCYLAMNRIEAYAADHKDKPKVTVNIKIEKPLFTTTLTATDASYSSRIAKENEILYFVNKSTKSDEKRNVTLSLKATPSILSKYLNKGNVQWKQYDFNESISSLKVLEDYAGNLNIVDFPIPEKSNYTFVSSSGNPIKDKEVKVKWVDEERQKIDVISKLSPLLEAFNEINYWSKEFKKFGIPCNVSVLDNVNQMLSKKQISVSFQKYNEENEKNRLFNKVQEFEFGASGMEVFKLSCGKELKIKIPMTSYEIDIASASIEISAGLKGSINIKREESIETNKVSFNNSKVSGGGYISPSINASIVGIKGVVEWEGGIKFEYPYKGNNSTIGLVLYSDDLVGKVLVSKDISLFITKDFSYEVFRLSTNGDLELVKLDFNQLLK